MYSHLAVMLTDPGAVPKDSCPLEDDVQEIDFRAANMEGGVDSYNAQMNRQRTASRAHIPVTVKKYRKFCKRCKAFKPIRAHHCSICGRCIIKMDHHCPWVNNCIGQYNQKYFLLFLFYVILGEMYAVTLILIRGYVCIQRKDCEDPIEPMGPLVGIFMTIVSVFFLIFVCTMGCEQYDAIHDDLSAIDRLQHRYVSFSFFSSS